MAVYFDFKVQAVQPGQNSEVQWHKTYAILACASFNETTGGSVNLYLDEGEHVPDAVLQRSFPAGSLAWHPTKKILATGWDNGEILIWNEQEHELHEAVKVHSAAITILQWSSKGTRLVSGDESGQVIVWKADVRGRLQPTPLCQHKLTENITQLTFKPPPPVDPAMDISAIARAAVSGDESALDMFSWKKGKNNAKMPATGSIGPQEALAFFVGDNSGNVHYVNENGKCTQSFQADGTVHKLLYYDEKNILVCITDTLMLSQHSVSANGDVKEVLKVKLSGKGEDTDIIWAGPGLLATATGEMVVRMWDLENEDNFVLNLEGQSGYESGESILCLSYCTDKGVLAGGTSEGKVAMWKYSPGNSQNAEDLWKLQPPSVLDAVLKQITWGSNKNLLAVNAFNDVYILSEQVMSAHIKDQVAVVQTAPSHLSIDLYSSATNLDLKTDIQIKGVYAAKDNVAVWNGKRIVVYDIASDKYVKAAGTFNSEANKICLHEQNIYTIDSKKIQVRTFQGTVKQLLNFVDTEGEPTCMDICGMYLTIATTEGVVKIFDLSRREAKQHAHPKSLPDVISHFGDIAYAKSNCNGSRVAVVVRLPNGETDPKLYIWDIELDTIQFFNFQTGHGDQDDELAEAADADQTAAERGANQAAKDIAGRYPANVFWDPLEPKLLVCQIEPTPELVKLKEQESKLSTTPRTPRQAEPERPETMIVSLFTTQENGIMMQDMFVMNKMYNELIGIEVPYYYFVKKSEQAVASYWGEDSYLEESHPNFTASGQSASKGHQAKLVGRRTMRDFIGLEDSDKSARDAMMNFSYYLTIGNMDEAFKAIKLIKSEAVWENMAKMCVKTRRLDVASVCLGNMGHAGGAKALREAKNEPELDAQVAVLAIHLGLQDDAERLLKNCKRYDLLNEFYQASGQWGKAMETAEMYDRIHLRTTYYNYAKHLEAKGDINGAIPIFEKSDTHRFEVPRMLFDEPQVLEGYIMKTKDKALRKWWAQYMESTGEMETALQFYEASQDYLSLVRVYCYCGNLDKASEICNETGDRAGCYHLARQYESQDNVKEAIHFFTRAQAYGNAIRLCKENSLEDQLMNLALLSRPEDQMEAARYYEDKPGSQDKAVMLYHKSGHFSKALELAFSTRQFGALQLISEDLDSNTDPELLQRCADFFLENGQYDRAVDLLAAGKKYWDALKLCMDQNVHMTDDLAENLTMPKGVSENENEERNKILEAIAEICMNQREYHLATKKYTQAGNRVKAMKALLKSGDTEKIVFFAGVSRQKEIYVMAANYLQSLDWRKDPEIMKNIISFYTKGRALDSLSSFYDACAQVEIDEYQNYDKALGALNEAAKCLAKAKMKNQSQQEERLAALKHKIGLIKKFLQARRVYDEDPDEAIKHCQILMEESDVESGVRMGDIYGFVIEHYARKEKWKPAYSCMEDMRGRIQNVNISYYISMRTIEAIHRALDIPLGRGIGAEKKGIHMNGTGDDGDIDGEIVDEEVIDDFDDGNV